MTASVTGMDIALRLLAALVAGGVIGLDRSMRGRIAGLRTTILMCLAAPAYDLKDLTKHDGSLGNIREKTYSYYKVSRDWN